MKKTYSIDGKLYEAHISADGRYLVSCIIFEVVHPNRKFFRMKYLDSKTFFIDDYISIDVGIKTMIGKIIQEKWRTKERQRKWEEFENTY